MKCMEKDGHQKVVVLESNHIITAGLIRYLTGKDELEVFGLENVDPDEILEKIEQMDPDVLVLDTIFARKILEKILTYAKLPPRLRTIILDVENDWVEIYDKYEVQVHSMSDFDSIL
jgi:DNA-binding NarL/FixJ family response regulator